MDLKEFIKESLLNIHTGLKEVNQEISKHYKVHEKKNIFLLKPGSNLNEGCGISFDIAVMAKKEKTKAGKGGFAIKVIDASIGTEQGNIEEKATRIQFTVHVTKWAGTFFDID